MGVLLMSSLSQSQRKENEMYEISDVLIVASICLVFIAFFLGPCTTCIEDEPLKNLSSDQRIELERIRLEKMKIIAEKCPCLEDENADRSGTD